MDGWIDGRTNDGISPHSTGLSPTRAAAQKLIKVQGNGYRGPQKVSATVMILLLSCVLTCSHNYKVSADNLLGHVCKRIRQFFLALLSIDQ